MMDMNKIFANISIYFFKIKTTYSTFCTIVFYAFLPRLSDQATLNDTQR